jgi:hypothetical protein
MAKRKLRQPKAQLHPYLNFGTLVGPISLDDPDYTEIFGKKDTAITSYTVAIQAMVPFHRHRSTPWTYHQLRNGYD